MQSLSPKDKSRGRDRERRACPGSAAAQRGWCGTERAPGPPGRSRQSPGDAAGAAPGCARAEGRESKTAGEGKADKGRSGERKGKKEQSSRPHPPPPGPSRSLSHQRPPPPPRDRAPPASRQWRMRHRPPGCSSHAPIPR